MTDTHHSHFVNLRADSEGIWLDIETDSGEVATGWLAWHKFHSAYQAWLDENQETNEMQDLARNCAEQVLVDALAL